jgi:hypothetical protein
MKCFLTAVLLLILARSHGQDFSNFYWKAPDVEFASVEMKVQDDNKKIIFNGYKDGYVKFDAAMDNPLSSRVTIKLAGYFEIENGEVLGFNVKSDFEGTTIAYTVKSGDTMCAVLIFFETASDKPKYIVVTGAKDYNKKPMKTLSFTIKGFS